MKHNVKIPSSEFMVRKTKSSKLRNKIMKVFVFISSISFFCFLKKNAGDQDFKAQ